MADKDTSKRLLAGYRDPGIDRDVVQEGGQRRHRSNEAGRTKVGDPKSEPESRPKRAGFMETLQRHFTAATYAEAGEFESAHEFLEPQPRTRSILLVIEGDVPDKATFVYSLGLCTRMDAELDILQVIQETDGNSGKRLLGEEMANGTEKLAKLLRTAEERKIPFKVTMRIGDVSEKLVNHARRHRDVAMIVIDSHRTKTKQKPEKAWEKFLRQLSRELSVPITTVLPKGTAFA